MTAHPPTVAVVIALQPLRRAGARDEEPDAGACRPARTTAPQYAIDVACIAVPTALPEFRAWRIGTDTRIGKRTVHCNAWERKRRVQQPEIHGGARTREQERARTEANWTTTHRGLSAGAHSEAFLLVMPPSVDVAGRPRRYGNQSSPFSSAHRMKAPGSRGTRYSLRTRSSATAEIVSLVSRP